MGLLRDLQFQDDNAGFKSPVLCRQCDVATLQVPASAFPADVGGSVWVGNAASHLSFSFGYPRFFAKGQAVCRKIATEKYPSLCLFSRPLFLAYSRHFYVVSEQLLQKLLTSRRFS